MPDYVSVDISEFQPAVNDSYPHRWLSFRVCDGDYVDAHVGLNLAWSLHAKATGKIDGFTVYVVYRPFKNSVILQTLDRLGVPSDCVVMIDAETWEGQISGDHSAELNALADALAARQKSQHRVWGYGNRGDLASLWPGRPAWLGVVVASYGGSKPVAPGLVGWQYTDGQYDIAGLPSSSSPFGPCDHNVFSIGSAIHTDTTSATPLTVHQEDDMAQYKAYRSAPSKGGDGSIYLAAPGHWQHASVDDWAVALKDDMVEKGPDGKVILRDYPPAYLPKRRHVYLGSNA